MRQLAELCVHGRLDGHAIKDNVVQVGGNYEMCPGGRLIEVDLDAGRFKTLVPIPWCSEHHAPFEDAMIDAKTICGYAFWADCAGRTFTKPCQIEKPQRVYRIGVPDGS